MLVIFLVVVGGLFWLLKTKITKAPIYPGLPPGTEEGQMIRQGPRSGVGEAKNLVITTEAEWLRVFSEIAPHVFVGDYMPAIDFTKESVVAVFAGQKPNGGYGFGAYLSGLRQPGKSLTVHISENSPGPNCVTEQVLTTPYVLIKIPKTDQKIVFETTRSVVDCK